MVIDRMLFNIISFPIQRSLISYGVIISINEYHYIKSLGNLTGIL